ncbi:TlpA disulfide reductase family protein [Ignavibacteriales bacterium]
MKIKLTIAVLLVVSVFAFTACNKKTQEQPAENKKTEKNEPQPTATKVKAADFSLKNAKGGMDIKLSDYKGKIVIVDFWATWCPPCVKGVPDLVELQKKYGDDLVVIGISVDDAATVGDVPGFLQAKNVNYPVAYYTNEVSQAYGGIESIPTSFIIDREGNIVEKHVGLVDISAYESAINSLK